MLKLKDKINHYFIEYLSYLKRYNYMCFIFIIFLWYGNHPEFIEKKFFINELLSLIGFFIFFSKPIIYKKNDYIYNTVILTLFIFIIYAVCSLMIFKSFYGYLRNTSTVYSIFSFFIGIKLYRILPNIYNKDMLFIGALLPGGSFYRTSYAASLPIYLSKYLKSFNGFSLFLIIVVMLSVRLNPYWGGSTSIAIILLLLMLQLLTKRTKMIFYIVSVVMVTTLLVVLKPYLDLMLLDDRIRIDNIQEMNPLFTIDGNTTTRLFIWGYLVFEVFLNNLFGIGLGTTIIPKSITWYKLHMFIHDPYLEYTLGAHNSFLTILVRFGIIGFLPFIILYNRLFNDFITAKESKENNEILFFYYSFFIISGCALINVVLESPLHASFYWGILGMLYQAKQT